MSEEKNSLSPRVKQLATNLSRCSVVLYRSPLQVASEGRREYDLYLLLQENATPEELSVLLKHESPVVRVYATMALQPKLTSKQALDLICQFEHDEGKH